MSTQEKTIYLYPTPAKPTEKCPERVNIISFDGDTGEVLRQTSSSNVQWGLRDNGHIKPLTPGGRICESYFNGLFPDGWKTVWLGTQFAGENKLIEVLSKKYEDKPKKVVAKKSSTRR